MDRFMDRWMKYFIFIPFSQQTVVEGKFTLEEGRMRLHAGLNKVKVVTSTLTSADEVRNLLSGSYLY